MLELIEHAGVMFYCWLLFSLLCAAGFCACLYRWGDRSGRAARKLYDEIEKARKDKPRERIAAMVPAE